MLDSKQLCMSEDSRIQAEDHYYAALDHFGEGRYQDAISEYRQALAIDPSFTDAMHGLARVLQDLERYDEAIEVAKNAGILAVEMEAAAIYAFAKARDCAVLCFAHVTNQMGRIEGDFEKGVADGAKESLRVVALAAASWRVNRDRS